MISKKARIHRSESGFALNGFIHKNLFIRLFKKHRKFLLLFRYPPAKTAGQVGETQEQSKKSADGDIFGAGNFFCFIYTVGYYFRFDQGQHFILFFQF